MFKHSTIIREKIKESLTSVLPVTAIVALLAFSVVPVTSGTFLAFLIGAVLLVVGMGFFSLGAEISMERMGQYVGARMTRSRKLWLIALLSFLVGVMITVSEPDLTVLASQVSAIMNGTLLIFAVGAGAVTKLVDRSVPKIERIFMPKYPFEYLNEEHRLDFEREYAESVREFFKKYPI